MKSMKGQSAVENLTIVAAVIALIIPISFLFITLSSFQKEQSEMASLESSLSQLSSSIEEIYSMCNEKKVERIMSLKFPASMQNLEFATIDGKPFLIATLSGGSEIAKNIETKPTYARFEIYPITTGGQIRGGNIMLKISCIVEEDISNKKTAKLEVEQA